MDKQQVIDTLNYLRSQELFAIQQYMNHYYRVKGQDFSDVKEVERSTAIAEMKHAELLAEKINMLGGEPIYQASQIPEMSESRITKGASTKEMLTADLHLERKAINDYGKAIRSIGDSDPGIRRLLEDILSQEQEHADTYSTWLSEDIAYEYVQLKEAG